MIRRLIPLASIIVLAMAVRAAPQTSPRATPPSFQPGVQQPTDPCEVVKCDAPSVFQQRLWIRLGYTGDTPQSRRDALASLQSLKPTERAQLEDPVPVATPAELAQLRACSSIVQKYRPEPDRPVDAQYETAYLGTCFHSLAEVPAETADTLRRLVVRLAGPQGEPCTALLLSDRVGLTARHCFQGPGEGAGAKLAATRLEDTAIHGSDASGTPWRRLGLTLFIDGAADRGAPIDVVAFSLKGSQPPFPIPPRVRLLDSREAHQHVRARQALLLASFPYGYEELRVDDFAACLALAFQVPFLVHHCQSLEGSSGAPLFVRLVGQPFTLGAVHVGAAGTVSGRPSRGQNEAVLLSADFVRAIRAAGITP